MPITNPEVIKCLQSFTCPECGNTLERRQVSKMRWIYLNLQQFFSLYRLVLDHICSNCSFEKRGTIRI